MFNEALVSFRSQVMFTIFKTILDKKSVASRFGDVGINKSTCVSILFIALKQFEWEMQLFDCCLFGAQSSAFWIVLINCNFWYHFEYLSMKTWIWSKFFNNKLFTHVRRMGTGNENGWSCVTQKWEALPVCMQTPQQSI